MKTARLNLNKNRVLLSDVLPYELPIIFSNRHLFYFLKKYNIHILGENLYWDRNTSEAFDKLIKCMFGLKGNPRKKDGFKFLYINKNVTKIPFQYEIRHKENNTRRLSLVHVLNQLQVVTFYDQYKELILYLCSQSSFSIRYPHHIAKYIFFKDRLHSLRMSTEELGIEQYDEEYETLKSFFVYEKYSNIYRFYDDFLFNRCEKKYNYLIKLDITRCFDSIYTHSIAWAIYGKEYTKKNNFAKTSFADKFDTLMQNLNYQETNGIVIGPEFSRIFAEIILQKVDKELASKLMEKGLVEKRDYEIFRYVDDFFVFYNNENDKNIILSELSYVLSKYKLYLNEEKKEIFEKPIISNISIAKSKIKELLDTTLSYIIEEKTTDGNSKKIGKININSRKFITTFKVIIKESCVKYKEVLNYTLSIIENKLQKLFFDFSEPSKDTETERRLFFAIQNLLESVTFIYSVEPRANTTIRLSRILKMIIAFCRRKGANVNYKFAIFEQIYNDINLVLKKNRPNEYAQVETSYLLIILQELGKNFDLSENELAEYFQLNLDDKKSYNLNYLSLMVLLFYSRGKKKYSKLNQFIIQEIKERLCSINFSFDKSEDSLLFLDTLSCPYIPIEIKRDILTHKNISDKTEQDEIIKLQRVWFINWCNFNLKKELDYKRGKEVY